MIKLTMTESSGDSVISNLDLLNSALSLPGWDLTGAGDSSWEPYPEKVSVIQQALLNGNMSTHGHTRCDEPVRAVHVTGERGHSLSSPTSHFPELLFHSIFQSAITLLSGIAKHPRFLVSQAKN